MKLTRILFLLLIFTAGYNKSSAQSFKLSESLSIKEMEEIAKEITLSNQRSLIEKMGFALTGSYSTYNEYKKSDDVKVRVYFKDGAITKTTLLTIKPYFDNVITAAKLNSYVKIAQEGDVEFYKKSGYNFGANTSNYQISISFKEAQLNGQTSVSLQAPEKYYSAKEIADALNSKIYSGRISSTSPTYSFDVLGSLNLDKKSFRFIAKNNILYLQINILRNGECEYGLKEVKAKFLQAGTGTDYFHFGFDFLYGCNGQDYKTIYAFFRPTGGFSRAGVEAWLNTNAR